MPELAVIASAIVPILALAGSVYAWRTQELRQDDVLRWGMECIEVLQTQVVLLKIVRETDTFPDPSEVRMLQTRASVLCEQGRLFFKNEKPKEHGQDKQPAYRGYRPKILDHLVLACKIFEKFSDRKVTDVSSITRIAAENEKIFVSLIQQEVGRGRTRSTDARSGGKSVDLEWLIAEDKRNSR